MKKISTLLMATLLTVSYGCTPLTFTDTDSDTNTSSIDIKVPKVEIISEDKSPTTLLYEAMLTMPNGQGNTGFPFKALGDGKTETIQTHVKNHSPKTINYKLIAPNGTVWSSESIEPGKTNTTQHVFGENEAGLWIMRFSNSDGSSITVETTVMDGI